MDVQIVGLIALIISTYAGSYTSWEVIYQNKDITGWRVFWAIFGLPGTCIGIICLLIVLFFLGLLLTLGAVLEWIGSIRWFQQFNERMNNPLFENSGCRKKRKTTI